MPKQSAMTSQSHKDIKYPTGCKEISEELATDDLIRRLKDIAMAFQQMSQEEDNSGYIPLALYLSSDYFLEHPSRDVRLLVACAIADVFRVYAPNAPYQHPELIKHIFLFFIQQLKGLQDPKDATFKRYFYLLENLAWVKSFNICIELEDSQYIFCQLFSLIFKIVNENHSDKVKNFMLDMLTPLIIEADTVSSKLIEIILWHIIDPKKTNNKQANWLAVQILKKTSKTMEPYLVSYFSNAITHGIDDNAGDLDNDDESAPPVQQKHSGRGSRNSKSASVSTSVTQICELIYELNRICPNIMDGILPQLEFKVKSIDEKERCDYTKLLARLFSDKDSSLAELYPDLWKSFLGRFRDISVTVRMRCVQYSMHFLVNHPELRDDIRDQLRQRQHDSDENVRYEVVMAIISAAKKSIENINEDLLSFVKERTLDKKFKIRREALLGMAQLYKQYNVAAMAENSDVNENVSESANIALRMLNWIKNKCLHNYINYQTQLDDRLLVERILHTCLIPYSLPLPQRMKSLYTFYCTIDSHAARAFNELLRQQQCVRKQVKEVLDLLKEEKTEDRDQLLKQKVQLCAKNLPEPVKADEYITKLCRNLEMNPALREHMELIVTSTSFPQTVEDGTPLLPPPSSTIELSVREVLKSLGFPVQTNSFYVIIKQLMERIAPIMVDHTGLLTLFNYVSDSLLGDGELDNELGIENSAKRGLQLIYSLSSVFPALFHGREIFSSYLLPFLWQSGDQHQVSELILQILTNIGAAPGTEAPMIVEGAQYVCIPWWAADDVIPRLVDRFVLKASTTKQAKYAIQCLNAIISDENEKMKVFGEIIDQIKVTGLSLETSPYFRSHLVTLGMIAICGGYAYFPKVLRSIIQKFIVQGLLMKDMKTDLEIASLEESERQRDSNDPNITYEFCSEEVKAKIEGIKLMVRWLYGIKVNSILVSDTSPDINGQYQKTASNTLKLLKTIIQNGGDLNEQNRAGTTLERAHIRLAAALAILKIGCNDAITSVQTNGENTLVQNPSTTLSIMSADQWHTLSTVLLDNEEFVREKFSIKLHKGLMSLSLGLEFLAILCLGGTFNTDSTIAFKNKLKSYLLMNLAKRRELIKSKSVSNLKSVMPDCVMPYVIHLLAYMPFYVKYDDVSQLDIVKECLWFIMDPLVLKNEHYSFSFFKKTFENIKLCVDKVSQTQDSESNESNANTMATMTNYKIYCGCDLALGLVMSKTQNFLLKDFPVQPSLPPKYFTVSASAADNNLKCYLPTEMQFAPPKRCGLEAEILGKITKSFPQSPAIPPPQRGRPSKASQQQQQQLKQQIVVITGENVIEEGVIIEQEGDNTHNIQIQRTRKQQIETINSEDDTNGTEKVETLSKKPKIEQTVTANTVPTLGRMTRASASKTVSNESTDKTLTSNEETEKSEPNDDIEEEEEDLPEVDEEEEEEYEEEEQSAPNEQKETQVLQKRTRGRPPKNVVPTTAADDDSSPQRKSARIAKKVPSQRSPSPELSAPIRGRGRGRGRGRR